MDIAHDLSPRLACSDSCERDAQCKLKKRNVMKYLVAASVVVACGWSAPAYAQIVFNESFEVPLGELHSTGPVVEALKAKGWAGFIEGNPADEIASIVSKTSRTGAASKVLRYRYGFMETLPQGTDWKNVKLTRFFPGITEMWTRGWYRWEKLDPTRPSKWVSPLLASSKQQYFNPGIGETVGGAVEFHASWAGNELMTGTATPFSRVCPNGGSDQQCNYYPNQTRVAMTIHNSPADRPTEWACVEAHWKFNSPVTSANGILELYVNNTLTTRYTNVLFANAPPVPPQTNTFRYVQLYRQSAENMFRYEDDFAISTQRVGCDRTVPEQPEQPGATCGDGSCNGDETCSSCANDCAECPVTGKPAPVTDLSAAVQDSGSVELTYTAVDDGTGQPAKYEIRLATPTMSWGSAAAVATGSCAGPLEGVEAGQPRTCTVTGLTPETAYQFQLVSYRGTLNQDAVFGVLSNIVSASTSAIGSGPDGSGSGDGGKESSGCRTAGGRPGWTAFLLVALSVMMLRARARKRVGG
jgi:hypothetical protein